MMYLFEMYSFQDVEKIPRVVQLGHKNVTTVIATLLCEPRHFIQKALIKDVFRIKLFQNEIFENPANIRHFALKCARRLELALCSHAWRLQNGGFFRACSQSFLLKMTPYFNCKGFWRLFLSLIAFILSKWYLNITAEKVTMVCYCCLCCSSIYLDTHSRPEGLTYSLLLIFSKIRLCALNDDSSEESDHEPTQESVKQAKVGN